MTAAPSSIEDRELSLTRIIDVPADKLFKCWTTAERLNEWFCPKPWSVSHAEMDVRSGGSSLIVMRGPNGEEVANPGLYLEVVENKRIVFTDAFTSTWVPAGKPFMVGIIEFEDLGDGKTRYTATARHWTVEDRQAHEQMGFHEGWGIVADQLTEVAKTF
ncbi:SRPBCC family protein [soil metagenome]